MKTITRQAFEAANQSLKSIEAKQKDLSKQEHDCLDLADKLKAALIKEEQILSKLDWELRLSSANILRLHVIGGDEEPLLDILQGNSWHYDTALNDKTDISFDDRNISIHISDVEHLSSIINEFGIKFSLEKNFKNKIQMLEQLVKSNQSIMDMAK
jgi:hypothetical protein